MPDLAASDVLWKDIVAAVATCANCPPVVPARKPLATAIPPARPPCFSHNAQDEGMRGGRQRVRTPTQLGLRPAGPATLRRHARHDQGALATAGVGGGRIEDDLKPAERRLVHPVGAPLGRAAACPGGRLMTPDDRQIRRLAAPPPSAARDAPDPWPRVIEREVLAQAAHRPRLASGVR